MAIGDEACALAAHHHRQLGVRLQLDKSEDHLSASAFQIARPADVGLFVKARLQFHKRSDRLASLRRLHQGAHDGAVGGRAIERLLDGHDIGIARCLRQKLHHHIEGFVRVVDDEVFLLDGGEAIARIVAHALGIARIIGDELQFRPVERNDFRQLVKRKHTVMREGFVSRHVQLFSHESRQIFRRARIHLQPDHAAATTSLQRAFKEANEVFGLFLQLKIAVPDHAEIALPEHAITGKQAARLLRYQRLQRHKPRDVIACIGQADEALNLLRQTHKRVQALAVGLIRQSERDGETKIGDEGKRMRWINRQRRQDRENLGEKIFIEPSAGARRQTCEIADDDNPGLAKLPAQIPPALLLRCRQHAHAVADLR